MHRLSRILSVCTLLLAFALFVHNLDVQSIWRDEALTILRARQSVAGIFQSRNIVQGVDSPDLHPPLYFLILHGWRAVLGEATFLWRYPSALFMLMALAAIGSVGQKIAGGSTGVCARVLLLVTPFCWWYAQEARMYALVVLLGALFLFAWWNLLSRIDNARARDWIYFSVAAAALAYTHYVTVFLVAAAVATLLWWKMSKRLLLALFTVAVVVIVPLWSSIGVMLVQRFEFIESRTFRVLLTEPLTTFWLGTTVPPTALIPVEKIYLYLPWVLLLLIAFAGWNWLSNSTKSAWLWLSFSVGGIVLTVMIVWVVGFVVPNYSNPRHLTVLFPLVYVVLAVGLTFVMRFSRIIGTVVLLSACFVGGSALAGEIESPVMVRDDVIGIRDHLASRVRAGDMILWHDPDVAVSWDIYALPEVEHGTLPRMFQDEVSAEIELQSHMQTYDRIWFIDAYGRDSLITQRLRSEWVQDDQAIFEGSWIYPSVTLYRKPEPAHSLTQRYSVDGIIGQSIELVALTSEEQFMLGEGVWFEAGWNGDGAEAVCVELLDSAEKSHAQTCTTTDSRPTRLKMMYLELPVGIPPIDYRLQLTVGSTTAELGNAQIEVADSLSTPSIEVFEKSTLIALNWEAERFTANNWAIGSLVWQIDAAADQFSAEVRLVNLFGRQVGDPVVVDSISVDYPPADWQIGDVLKSDFAVRLPFELDGRYRLQLRTTSGDGWQSVGSTKIDPVPFMQNLPSDVEPLSQDVVFAENIKLEAQTLRRDGDQLIVELYWRMNAVISAEYNTFIHLTQLNEPPLAQSGGIPVGNSRPTSTWREGELIHDSYTLDASALEADDDLVILIGLFDPLSGARPLVTVDGQAQTNNAWNAGVAR